MAFWNYVIYPKSDFATLDFTSSVTTNATLNPIYITVEDDDANFNQIGGDTGTPQIVTSSSIPGLVGLPVWSEVYGNADVIYQDSGGSVLTINEISIGGLTDYVLANLDGVNTTLSPSTTYSDTSIRSDTSWAHSGSPPCFTTGTRILTPKGEVPIETLFTGDKVLTADHGAQKIHWIGQRTVTKAEMRRDPKLRPIRIRAGAMGAGLPRSDLIVSRQHRMLIRSPIAKRIFGTAEVLLPAHKLIGLPGIEVETGSTDVTYVHILCRRHELLYANRCPAESLYLGPRICDASRDEAFALYPSLKIDNFCFLTARLIASGKRAARLIARHAANGKAPLQPIWAAHA